MRDLAHLVLDRPKLQRLAELCGRDPRFPRSWAAWEALQERAASDARRAEFVPAPLTLDPEEFATWCERVEILPGLDALRAFAVVTRARLEGPSP